MFRTEEVRNGGGFSKLCYITYYLKLFLNRRFHNKYVRLGVAFSVLMEEANVTCIFDIYMAFKTPFV